MADFVEFDAEALDHQGRTLEVTWESDRDGLLGSSKLGLGTDNLSEGIHFITARASDNLGDTAQQMLMITVTDQPTIVKILSPSAGATTWLGQSIFLAGAAEDPDLLGYTVPSEDLRWSVTNVANLHQPLFVATGSTAWIPKNTLAPGAYVVRLSATVDGNVAAVQRTFWVKVPPAGAIPNTVIDEPANEEHFGFGHGDGATIHFAGHATDAEDGVLSGTRLRWTALHTDDEGHVTTVVLCTGSDVPDDEEPNEPGLWLQGNGGNQPGPQFKAVVDCSSFDATLGLNGEIGAANWTIVLEAFDSSGGPAGEDRVMIEVHLAVA
jgi:hypothetical protein